MEQKRFFFPRRDNSECLDHLKSRMNFKNDIFYFFSDWLTTFSFTVTHLLSPLIIGVCRRKSTRVSAVIGGFITALGCLFTSFADQFHQLYLSYGIIIGKDFRVISFCSKELQTLIIKLVALFNY